MKWLNKLEYKFGRRYIRRLMTIIIVGMAVVYFMEMFANQAGMSVYTLFSLNRAAIFQGQVWRLVTFLFLPPTDNPIFLIISLYFYYMMGNLLESAWGGFRLNIYYLFGILGCWVSMLLTGVGTNSYLNLSLFLAYATIAPDTRFMLFFIIPIKAKWMAIAYAAMLGLQLLFQFIASPAIGLFLLVSLALSLINYVIFFGRSMVEMVREQIRIAQNRRNWRNRNR